MTIFDFRWLLAHLSSLVVWQAVRIRLWSKFLHFYYILFSPWLCILNSQFQVFSSLIMWIVGLSCSASVAGYACHFSHKQTEGKQKAWDTPSCVVHWALASKLLSFRQNKHHCTIAKQWWSRCQGVKWVALGFISLKQHLRSVCPDTMQMCRPLNQERRARKLSHGSNTPSHHPVDPTVCAVDVLSLPVPHTIWCWKDLFEGFI